MPAPFAGVPPKPKYFLGRNALVDALAARLMEGSSRFVAVEGLPAVGKTTLAIAVAHAVREHFEEGVLWAGLGPTPNISRVLDYWAEALGRDASQYASEPEKAQAVKDAIGQRRMLLVIDDVWSLDAAQVLCLADYGCHLLTTRNKAIAKAFDDRNQAAPVMPLDGKASCDLLALLAPEAFSADERAARALAIAVDGLPLALELLGGYLAAPERSYFPELSTEALEQLKNPKVRLGLARRRVGAISGGVMSLEDTIAMSLEGLDERAVDAFHALGAFAPKPADFTREAALAVTAASPATLALLIARNLLETRGDRFALHQTLADVARTRLPEAAIHRHRDHYLSLARRKPYIPSEVFREYPQMKRVWELMPESPELYEWIWALRTYQVGRGLWSDSLEWCTRALRLAESENRAGERGVMLANSGLAHYHLGDPNLAIEHYRAAVPLLDQAGDRAGLAVVYNNIGVAQRTMGRLGDSLESFVQARSIAEEFGDRAASLFVHNLVEVGRELGALDRVIPHFVRSKLATGDQLSITTETKVSEAIDSTLSRNLTGRHSLLVALDSLVAADQEPPELVGGVCIVVRMENGSDCMWYAMFGSERKVSSGFCSAVPPGIDAILLLSEREADYMIATGALPPGSGLASIGGDRGLLERFVHRYTTDRSSSPGGEVFLVAEKYPEAEEAFTAAIAEGRNDAQVFYFRGLARQVMEKYEEAAADYTQAISLGEDTADVYFRRGVSRVKIDRFTEAVSDFTSAIERGRNGGDVYMLRGLAHSAGGFSSEAEADFAKAIELGLDDKDAYYWRGRTRRDLNKNQDAEADFTAAIQRGRSDGDIYYRRGMARASLDRYEEAEADFSEAIAHDKRDAETYTQRGRVRLLRSNHEGAEADFTEAISLGSTDPLIIWARGIVRIAQYRYAESLSDLNSAIEAGRKEADSYYWRGQAFMVLGRYAEAESDFTAAIAAGQDDAAIYQRRGGVLCRLKRLEDALADCEKAESRAPEDPFTHGTWADLHLARGEYQDAITRSEAALTAAGGTGWHFELGLALLMAGRVVEAIAAYERGIGESQPAERDIALRELEIWNANPPEQIRNLLSRSASQIVGPVDGRAGIE